MARAGIIVFVSFSVLHRAVNLKVDLLCVGLRVGSDATVATDMVRELENWILNRMQCLKFIFEADKVIKSPMVNIIIPYISDL